VLLAPLVLLHLRRGTSSAREVPSLLLWHEFELGALGGGRRLRPPPLPFLLILQAVALVLLVLALAEPDLTGGQVRPTTVVVLDDSFWMTAPGALADAREEVDHALAPLSSGAPVRIVLADGAASVLYRGSASGARAALRRVQVTTAPADLSAGLAIAAGLLTGPRDRVVLVRAAGDPAPAVSASPGELRTLVAGGASPDTGIFSPTARCGIGTPATCEVVATVANAGSASTEAHVVAAVSGQPSLSLSARVAAHARTQIRFLTDPGEQVSLRLTGADAISADNQAWVTVPGDDDIPRTAVVTVVGMPTAARTLAQAFAAVPGVTLRLETPADYRASVARSSDLVVLDGPLPDNALPPAAAVMLIDPGRLPGGQVGGTQADPTLSGVDSASPLLENADLSSLTLNSGAARRLTLPHWLTRVLWSPSGPLLAAGDDGHGRLTVTAFQPASSTLAQLDAFPVLAANIVRWSLGWAPASATSGTTLAVDALPGAQNVTLVRNGTTVERVRIANAAPALALAAPGAYTVLETGSGVSHQAAVDVNLDPGAAPATGPTDIRAAQLRPTRRPVTPLAPWLLLAGLVVLALEWAYWATRRTPVAV
jgi:hypothetical protein